jgi:hypothetical protein
MGRRRQGAVKALTGQSWYSYVRVAVLQLCVHTAKKPHAAVVTTEGCPLEAANYADYKDLLHKNVVE